MPVTVNLRQLEKRKELRMEGDVPAADYAADFKDELIRLENPMHYALEVQHQGDSILVTGSVATEASCECARCLRPFPFPVSVENLAALVPLTGEEAPPRDGDFADLTPLLREDIYLGLPANPLCRPDCRGLPQMAVARDSRLGGSKSDGPSPWAALDRIKL